MTWVGFGTTRLPDATAAGGFARHHANAEGDAEDESPSQAPESAECERRNEVGRGAQQTPEEGGLTVPNPTRIIRLHAIGGEGSGDSGRVPLHGGIS